jgi:hypothetical protein
MKKKILLAALAIVAAACVFSNAQSKKMAAELMVNQLLEAKTPQEKGKLLDPAQFRDTYVADTYRIVAKNREAIDKQFCYCYCAMNPKFNHKSLLSCYVDDHGANCDTCMTQARETAIMTKDGKSPREIAMYFKKKYVKEEGPEGHSHP